MVIKLQTLIEESEYDKASVEGVLFAFVAVKSASKQDVQSFLKTKAYDMENKGQSVTYLILNDGEYEKGRFVIDGYFTLAIKAFEFCEDVSKRNRRRLSGKSDDFVPAYLIGQLARSSETQQGFGAKLLALAIAHVRKAAQIVGGRLIYLDCKDQLIKYYENNGFTFLQKPEDFNQMYMVL